MRTKHWLPVLSTLIAASIVVACGSDDDSTPADNAGSHSGGSAGAHPASGGNSGTGTTHAGAGNVAGEANVGGAAAEGGADNAGGEGGTDSTAGTGTGGSSTAGHGGTAGGGGTAAGGGASGGTAGASGGTGGTSGGSGAGGSGGTSGAGGNGGGGTVGVNLCDKNIWKYTFQVYPHPDYASGAYNLQPTLAVDGLTSTFVTSGKTQDGTFYALIDLHGAVNVSSIVIDYTGSGKESDFSPLALFTSDNGTDFTAVAGATATALINHQETITVPSDVTHRYLKVTQTGTANWWAIPEVNLTCVGNGTPATPTADAVTARADWKIVTPNSTGNTDVTKMVDADATTGWQSGGKPGVGYWFRVDLGSSMTLSNVDFKVPTGNTTDFPAKVKLQVSTDDITFVDAKTGVTGAAETKIVLDTPQAVRYFRVITEADTAATAWWTIGDLNVNVTP